MTSRSAAKMTAGWYAMRLYLLATWTVYFATAIFDARGVIDAGLISGWGVVLVVLAFVFPYLAILTYLLY